LRWADALGLRIEWGKIVINNPIVIANLYRLNQAIIKQGKANNAFTIRITGGDRFIDSQGNFVSLTDFSMIPPSATNRKSEHLIENGARGVDLVINGINRQEFDRALMDTDFSRFNTIPYPDHIHIALPDLPKFRIDPDSLPTPISGRYGP
jgi:hypothetical protein